MLLKRKNNIMLKFISWTIMLIMQFSILDFIKVKAENTQDVNSESVSENKSGLWEKYKKWIILGSSTSGVATAGIIGVIISKCTNGKDGKDSNNYKVCIIGNSDEKQFSNMMNDKGNHFKITGTKDGKNLNISLYNVPKNKIGNMMKHSYMKNSDMNILMLDLDNHTYNRQNDIEQWLDIIESERSSSRNLMLVGTYNEEIKNSYTVGRLEGLTGCYTRCRDINMIKHDITLLDMSKTTNSKRTFENELISHLDFVLCNT